MQMSPVLSHNFVLRSIERKYIFFLSKHLKMGREGKKSRENILKSFPLDFFYEGIFFLKIVFCHYFRMGIILTPSLIGILKIRLIFRIILLFSATHFFPPKNMPKIMTWMFRPAISLICTIETSFKRKSYRY